MTLKQLAISPVMLIAAACAANAVDSRGAPAAPFSVDEPGAVMREAMQALHEGRYLEATDRLEAAVGTPPDRSHPLYSLWLQTHSFTTNLPVQIAGHDQELQPLGGALAEALAKAGPADAIDEIVARARDTRIVILNEAHHVPRDRAFALAVARALRPLGYDVLAAETFTNSPSPAEAEARMAAMAEAGYPRLGDGMYLKDPVFGDFVRQAMGMGYRPVAYEQTASGDNSIAAREQSQAENLVQRIFSRDAGARVLIFVGYSHAAEAPLGSHETEWMAARLKRMTGIDPLTIDQTGVSEFSEHPAQRRAWEMVETLADRAPVVLTTAEGAPLIVGRYAGKMDLQVVHPRTRLRGGRPTWLWDMGREARAVPEALKPVRGRRLVQAFIADEGSDAVPVDQVLIRAGEPLPMLLLPRGAKIRYEVQDPGRISRE